MGLKIRLGMAGIGLIMSYFFGLNGLSGVATHLDSTGNILVDIADGIGLVSKVSKPRAQNKDFLKYHSPVHNASFDTL